MNAALNLVSTTTIGSTLYDMDEARAVVKHPLNSDIYVVGTVTAGVKGLDIYVGRYSQNLAFISSITINGMLYQNDHGYGICADTSGNIYITGSIRNYGSNGDDIFVAKLNPNLSLIASTTVNWTGNAMDAGKAVAVNTGGIPFVAGQITESGGETNIFIGKFNSGDLSLASSTTLNGTLSGADCAEAIAINPSNSDLFITGFVKVNTEGDDIYIARYTSTLTLVSSTTINGTVGAPPVDHGKGITIDYSSGVYVTGDIQNATTDIYLGRFKDSDLSLISSTTLNGSANSADFGYCLSYAKEFPDKLFLTGQLNEATGGPNMILAKFTTGLMEITQVTYDRSGFNDSGFWISLDTNTSNIFVAGMIMPGAVNADLCVWKYNETDIPPGAITTLSALPGIHEGNINLSWIAPGDDGYSGTLSNGCSFYIQYSTWTNPQNIVWSTSSANITISTNNVNPGNSQALTITGLSVNTTYYFRIWTSDKLSNISVLSNGATDWLRPSSVRAGINPGENILRPAASAADSVLISTYVSVTNTSQGIITKWSLQISTQEQSTDGNTWLSCDSNYPAWTYGYSVNDNNAPNRISIAAVFSSDTPSASDFADEDILVATSGYYKIGSGQYGPVTAGLQYPSVEGRHRRPGR